MAPKDPYKYFRVEAHELLDALSQGVLALEKGGPNKELLGQLLRHAHTLKGAARVVRMGPIADLIHGVEEILAPIRDGAGEAGPGLAQELLAKLDAVAALLAGLGQAAPEPGGQAPPPQDKRLESVRLDISELDGVLECLREASGRLSSLKGQVPGAAKENLEQLERELELAHDRAGRMRLLPASGLFNFLERSCRDAGQALGKQVRFEALGAEARLDAPVLAALQEALQHVVRNAVVHGIEAPAQRLAAGKPAEGRVWVELRLEAGKAHFRCGDDGRGLDLEALARAAKAKGRLSAAAPGLSEQEALGILLKGGLSTASSVTELSGRGLGLEILRETVERLKGSLGASSAPGKGLEFRIQVPASMSAYTALAVEGGGLAALLPFHAVQSAMRLEASSLSKTAEGQSIMADGEALPFLPFDACFACGTLEASRPRIAVLLKSQAGRAALGVERILGVREVVVLPLPELTPEGGLACGACLDAAGDPCMVLDPDRLVLEARSRRAQEEAGPAKPGLPVLVIDDSLTTRMLEQSILETAGYSVELASSAEEGLEKAQAADYGLILVDVEMPGMDGFQFLERVGQDARLRLVPAILVTSRASAEDRLRGLAVGARDYIIKGEFDQARLLSRIRELMA